MSSVNKAIIIGNLGREPEVRATQNGNKIVTLNIATSESWKDKTTGERKEKTEWHKIVIMNESLANTAENYLKKGSKVYVEGAIQTRKWTDKDSIERYSTEIVLQNYGGVLRIIDGFKKGDENVEAEANHVAPMLDDEIPF